MELKRTALYEKHIQYGAKIVPFAGFEMPVQYSGIIDEHLTVRKAVGVFDVSHMGEFIVKGEKALEFVNRMTTNNVAKLELNQIQYSTMLYDDAGVVDDLLVYKFADHIMLVVNAANLDKDFNWLKSHLIDGVELINESDDYSLLAVQGPESFKLITELADVDISNLQYYNFMLGKIGGIDCIISRTGYTGEWGYELYVKNAGANALWEILFSTGEKYGIKPIGLGARDTLRLESAYCLYGNDIDNTTHPLEAGLGWVVKSKKAGGFVGLDTLMQKKENIKRKLIGFSLDEKGIPRHGQEIMVNNEVAGVVTSGGFSPMLEKGIGLGYIDLPHNAIGNTIHINNRGRLLSARIVETPFYKSVG